MIYSTTRDLLDMMKERHLALSRLYAERAELAQSDAPRALLDHMSQHEQILHDSIDEYEARADSLILDSWWAFIPDPPDCTDGGCPKLEPQASVGDVARAISRCDNCMTRYYEEVTDLSELEEVHDVFENLKEMEQQERRRLALWVQDA